MITVTTREGEQQTQVIREKADEEFKEAENNKERADIQAIKILSQGLPKHIFNTQNQTKIAKEIWEKVELLMQGFGLTEQQQKETLFDQYERFRANGEYKVSQHVIFIMGKVCYYCKNNKDISTASYVCLYTHLKSYEQHAMKTLRKMNQTSRNADPLTYMAHIVNFLSGFQKQFPPTNNQFRTSTNLTTQAMIQAGQITTQNVQRRALEAKEKGTVLDAEAKAFLADMECIVSYAEPLAITTTTAFEVSHEEAYDSDVAPHAAAVFMPNLMPTSPLSGQGTSNQDSTFLEVHTYDNHFFDNLNRQVSQEMHQGEQLDFDVDSDVDDDENTIPYHQYQ
nr:hypothetical protein [Tanacetum cinerariifolium]